MCQIGYIRIQAWSQYISLFYVLYNRVLVMLIISGPMVVFCEFIVFEDRELQ